MGGGAVGAGACRVGRGDDGGDRGATVRAGAGAVPLRGLIGTAGIPTGVGRPMVVVWVAFMDSDDIVR